MHVNMLSAANIVPLRLAKQAGVRKVIAHSHNASAPGIVRKLMDGVNRPRMKHYVNEKFACSEKAGRWLFGDKAFERGEVTLVANALRQINMAFQSQTGGKSERSWGFPGMPW